MSMLVLFLMVLALVLFTLAAIGVPSSRFNLVAAGLASATLAFLLTHWPK